MIIYILNIPTRTAVESAISIRFNYRKPTKEDLEELIAFHDTKGTPKS